MTPPAARSEDEKAIKALLGAFVNAFNAGNAEAVAATYIICKPAEDRTGLDRPARLLQCAL